MCASGTCCVVYVPFDWQERCIGNNSILTVVKFKLMDRIYTICDEEYSSYFKKWASKNDYLHKKEQNWHNIHLKGTKYEKLKYLSKDISKRV